jgi:F-type H+-transporting ATPase subunit delta
VALAHRMYAEALFQAAAEKGRLDEVRRDFGDFAAMLEEVPELRDVLRNPQLQPAAKARVLDELLGGLDETVRSFLRLVAEKGRAGEAAGIHAEFERLMAREERRLSVELTTAIELPEPELREIVAQIERASGRTVEATTTVDPDLIGGLVLQVGTRRVDASVRGRLERLRRDLVRSA